MAALLGAPFRGACRGCSACCDTCLDCVCPPNAPSPLFLGYTLLVAGVPAAAAAIVLVLNAGDASKCGDAAVGYAVMFLLFQVFAVCFAWYLYRLFAKPYAGEPGARADPSRPHDVDPCARAGRLFCHDPMVAVALIAFPVVFVLAIVAYTGDVPDDCPSGVKGAATGWGPTLVLFYIIISGAVMGLSLCCLSCTHNSQPVVTTSYPTYIAGGGTRGAGGSGGSSANTRFMLFGPLGGALSYLFVPPQRAPPPQPHVVVPPQVVVHPPPPVVPPQYPAYPTNPTYPAAAAAAAAAPPPPPHPQPATGYPVNPPPPTYTPTAPPGYPFGASSIPAAGPGSRGTGPPSSASTLAGTLASAAAGAGAYVLRSAAAGLESASRPAHNAAPGQPPRR